MLKKKYRLLKEAKFDKKDFYTSPFFVLKVAKNEKSFNRFGFVVSKKIDQRATVRNRVKRRVRVCIESNFDKIKPGYDMLFILKKQILNKTTAEINVLTMEELKRLKLLK
ncbi:MAG: ribonuclease P protein component [Patescibacteria group bacterium]|nr:ribonuclease P protein component [Patescibacteria group bacterium]